MGNPELAPRSTLKLPDYCGQPSWHLFQFKTKHLVRLLLTRTVPKGATGSLPDDLSLPDPAIFFQDREIPPAGNEHKSRRLRFLVFAADVLSSLELNEVFSQEPIQNLLGE